MINSKEYWDDIFEKREKNVIRAQQTEFFVNLALNNLPSWITEDINLKHMSICDVGCAEGTGTEILSQFFSSSKVTGIDFSDQAIEVARATHSGCAFEVGDIHNLSKNYDILFTSNVLEHFFYSGQVLTNMIQHADKYCIILVPFREYYTVPEHFSYFDFQSFPLSIENKYDLCYFKPINIIGDDTKYWYGEQILVVYGKKDYLQPFQLTLRNLYNGYVEERTEIIQSYDRKIQELEDTLKTLSINPNERIEFEKSLEEKKDLENELKKLNRKYSDALEQENQLLNILSEKRAQVSEYENALEKVKTTLSTSDATVNALTIKLEKMQADFSNLSCINQYSLETLSRINESMADILTTQNSRSYKASLILRRFVEQCIRQKEKKDFTKWVIGKLFHKNLQAKWLCEYDYLEHAKKQLNLITPCPITLNSTEVTMQRMYGQIFIFASVPYYDVGGGQRSAQLAKTFSNMGYAVHYIYGFPCSEKDIPDITIPVLSHQHIQDIDIIWFKQTLQKNAIAIFEIPYKEFEPYLDIANKYNCHTIYEHIDNWDSSLGTLFYDKDTFEHFLKTAEIITVTAKLLGEKVKELVDRPYLYSPNAVNTEIFEPTKTYSKPNDLVIGKNKTLLYFGSLWGEWFDWEKIEYIACMCPDCTINLIGDASLISERVTSSPNNVYFLGLKSQTVLPAYLAYSDIALLPFKNCEIGKFVSPLKIFEYIAMNKRVLATPLDDIISYPNVFCSDNKEDWVKEIYRTTSLIDTSNFISQNNWYSRCNQILNLFVKQQEETISIIVLNYNNLNVIEKCIDSLISHNSYNYEIIVVDNGSSDGSYEKLQKKYISKITLLKNKQNGCSSGRNLGVSNATGDWIVFLDSDQWVISDTWLDCALNIMRNNITLGAISWNAGWFEPNKTTGPIVDYLPGRGVQDPTILYRCDIAYLATSGLLMRKSLFSIIEGFDEFYDPTCYEDTDLSLKIRNAGFEIAYTPYMAIMHLPHQTTKSGSSSHTKLMERNGEYFRKKWSELNPELLKYYLN